MAWLSAIGDRVDSADLRIRKARDLRDLLEGRLLPYVELIETRRIADDQEVVVLEIEPSLPQRPENDIRVRERIAVVFDGIDVLAPELLALRDDFPRVSHTNVRPSGWPVSLCLYEEPYETQKLSWTAAAFVRQLHRWLNLTARGHLHAPDQPLEQLFFLYGPVNHVILPTEFFDPETSDGTVQLAVSTVSENEQGRMTYQAVRSDGSSNQAPGSGVQIAGIVITAEPHTHGLIRFEPRTLLELHEFMLISGTNLVEVLSTHFCRWASEQPDTLSKYPLLVIRLPKRRDETSSPESVDVWAFLAHDSCAEIAEHLGVLETHDQHPVPILGAVPEASDLEDVSISLLNPVSLLTRPAASALNNRANEGCSKILAIGAGALGSQVMANLARAGYGQWTIVDRDIILPHNLARHVLPGGVLGMEKAEAVSAFMNSLTEEGDSATAVVADFLARDDSRLDDALSNAEIIVDLSASLGVSRRLAQHSGLARTVSLFLNPAGTDLVLLAEDTLRNIRLDDLEIQYYREITLRAELAEHLTLNDQPLRYGRSCRDVTNMIPQDAVAVFSGIGAQGTREALASPDASASIWQLQDDATVSRLVLAPSAVSEVELGEWTLRVSRQALEIMVEQRAARLPNETGGVLLGSWDTDQRIIYLVDALGAPSDSIECPHMFVRGQADLEDWVGEIRRKTAGWLGYVGEWHSHPEGVPAEPSSDDMTLLSWLEEHRSHDSLPGVMAIVAERGRVSWYAKGFGANAPSDA